jgi:hypothetical protein
MPKTCQVEVWVMVDDVGDYGVGRDDASAKEAYENDVQTISDAGGFRLVKVRLAVPPPAAVELAGAVPAEGGALLDVA